ncbi:MAG: hypothetical protein MZW92_03230 [Comamonadaceae bacterium]|nr:hypothetical protein [Comamonadaceae bacterium]
MVKAEYPPLATSQGEVGLTVLYSTFADAVYSRQDVLLAVEADGNDRRRPRPGEPRRRSMVRSTRPRAMRPSGARARARPARSAWPRSSRRPRSTAVEETAADRALKLDGRGRPSIDLLGGRGLGARRRRAAVARGQGLDRPGRSAGRPPAHAGPGGVPVKMTSRRRGPVPRAIRPSSRSSSAWRTTSNGPGPRWDGLSVWPSSARTASSRSSTPCPPPRTPIRDPLSG